MVVAIKRLALLDKKSQGSLYDHSWIWDGDHNSEPVTSLIRSFFQLASEVDTGEVTKVKFSPTDAKIIIQHSRSRSRTGPVLSVNKKAVSQEHLYLHCYTANNFIICAFIHHPVDEENDALVKTFLSQVNLAYESTRPNLEKFQELIDAQISELFGEPSIDEKCVKIN